MIGNDEIALSTAIENTKIRDTPIEQIKEVLRLVMIKIGLRSQNWPSDEEKLVLIEHIISKFGGHACEEIQLAFDMAIDGKLEDINFKGESVTVSVNCYENFSCLYFSDIMNGYRRWAKEAIRNLPKEQPKLIEDKKGITDEEMAEWVEDWKVQIKNISNPVLVPTMFYEWLIGKELLVLSNKQKHEYVDQAVSVRHFNLSELLKSEGEHSRVATELTEFKLMMASGCFEGHEVVRLKELAKKIAVFDYLKNNQK